MPAALRPRARRRSIHATHHMPRTTCKLTRFHSYIKFRRMKEKLGTIPNGGEETTGAGDATASGKSEKMTTKKVVKKSTSKKRKVEASEDVDDVDDGVKAIKEEVTEVRSLTPVGCPAPLICTLQE